MTGEDPRQDPPSPWPSICAGLVLLCAIPLVIATNDRINAFGFVEVILFPAVFGTWLLWVGVARLLRAGR